MAYPAGKNLSVAYLLWALGFFGLSGIHRFYLGKPITGVLWLCTSGLCFVGQFVDLLLIPGMVNENEKRSPSFLPPSSQIGPLVFGQQILQKLDRLDNKLQETLWGSKKVVNQSPLHQLIDYAAQKGNSLSLAQAMMATGLTVDETEKVLQDGMRKGIVQVGNDTESGAVRYYFDI